MLSVLHRRSASNLDYSFGQSEPFCQDPLPLPIYTFQDADGFGKSDPYVKFHLEKDNFGPFDVDLGKRESSKKNNTLNPEYGETFTFSGVPSLDKLVLHITVMDDDIGRDDKIGKTTVKIYKLEGDLSNFVDVEQKIDNKLFRADATIHLKIKYEE